ncbi:hypothetical protein HS088_TW07G00044 [Tripterygium wilfordii]|uniref:Uncharacterized protein n=1 Tax=Tripterygium wilfordii TaxID=458696 RepID=A0A7J7DDS2_TRIWF|nr:uncharacterized protein LOC120001386 [Tripterygium wilfordii]KAF5744473.1 hypothetical protein HS088_TW07G00044 [Tripterygium wilfordii]
MLFIQNILVLDSFPQSPAMNHMPVSADPVEDNSAGSDSDTNPDDAPEYYQPISPNDEEDSNSNSETEQLNSDEDHRGSNTSAHGFGNLPNGYSLHQGDNGISSLHLRDTPEEPKNSSSDDDEEEDEENRMRAASDSAMLRAFRENESRRRAPLTPENAMRVREAMRGVSFGGVAPDWARAVPEDQWINQLRRLTPPRGTSNS